MLMKRIDIGYLENILKELKAYNQDRLSISDVSVYLKMSVKEIKNNMEILKKNFDVSEGKRVYLGLRG